MSEQIPTDAARQRCGRMEVLASLVAAKAQLDLQIRLQLHALVTQDTAACDQKFVADELALLLAESPATTSNWIIDAHLTCAQAQVMARVADGTWTIRHADAVLDELTGNALSNADQQAVLALVLPDADRAADGGRGPRTPYELRKATRAAAFVVDLDAAERKQDKHHDDRGMVQHDEADGSVTTMLFGTKTQAAELVAAIDAHVAVAAPGDTRSLSQRRYDYVRGCVLGTVTPTEPWQALIVVALDTLEGGSTPAEIPGLGLVCAEEARDVLGQASLRRLVVDADGAMVSLDSTVLHPDATPVPAATTPVAAEARPEPADAVTEVEVDEVSVSDREWLAAQTSETPRPRLLLDLADVCDDAWAQLDALLEQAAQAQARQRVQARALVLAGVGMTAARCTVADLRDGFGFGGAPPDDPDPGPPGPAGPGGGPAGAPPPPPPSPHGSSQGEDTPPPDTGPDGCWWKTPPHRLDLDAPPGYADRDWHARQENRAETHDLLDALVHRSTPRAAVLRQTRAPRWQPTFTTAQRQHDRLRQRAATTRWTTAGLQKAVTTICTRTVEPEPVASSGYPFPPRAARWIKARDVTCTFPGCRKLAQHCQNDHVVPYPAGPTAVCNAGSECVHHHQAKHGPFTVTRFPSGTMRWQPPSGPFVDRHPRPVLRGW